MHRIIEQIGTGTQRWAFAEGQKAAEAELAALRADVEEAQETIGLLFKEREALGIEKAALKGALRAAALDRHGSQCGPRVAFSDCRAGVCQRVRALLDKEAPRER